MPDTFTTALLILVVLVIVAEAAMWLIARDGAEDDDA